MSDCSSLRWFSVHVYTNSRERTVKVHCALLLVYCDSWLVKRFKMNYWTSPNGLNLGMQSSKALSKSGKTVKICSLWSTMERLAGKIYCTWQPIQFLYNGDSSLFTTLLHALTKEKNIVTTAELHLQNKIWATNDSKGPDMLMMTL